MSTTSDATSTGHPPVLALLLDDPDTLSRDDRSRLTHDLLREAHDTADGHRRDLLVQQAVLLNRRVACAVAARYRRRGVPDDDLEQAACEGLVKAVSRFDPTLSHDLLTYAVPTIRGEVQRYFRDHAWMVRPPRRLQELQWLLERVTAEMAGELGREPSTAELCRRVDITAREHRETVQSVGCFRPSSLDQPVRPASDLTLGDTVADDTCAQERAEARVLLAPLLAGLGERDRLVVRRRFYDECTQQEIADELGITQTQVSRLLARVLGELRARLGDSGLALPA